MRKEAEKSSKEAVEQEIKECETVLQSMKENSGAYELFMRLNNIELPHIDAELKKLGKRKEALVDTYEKVINTLRSVLISWSIYANELVLKEAKSAG